MCELVIGKIRKENRGSSEKNSAMEGRGNLILGDGKENIVFSPQFFKNIYICVLRRRVVSRRAKRF